jgi:phosphate-selective porin OprO/OprP
LRFTSLSSLTIVVLPALFLPLPAGAQEAAPPPAPPAPAAPPPPATEAPSEPTLADVDQRSRIVERKLELLEEEVAKGKTAPVVTAGDRGFIISAADKAFQLRIRGLVQGDGRFYLDDKLLEQRDTFLIRKARPILEATLGGVADFRLVPDFASPATPIQDAYGDFRPWSWLKLRVGKFKSPISLERLQSDPVLKFVERGFPSVIAPNRDIGVQLHGEVGILSYALAVLNGSIDGGSNDADTNFAKDFAARLFLQPLRNDPYSALTGLGFGVAAITGNQRGTVAAPGLASYITPGQQIFFQYIVDAREPANTVIAQKRRSRLSPQLYYYVGPFGLLAEYIVAQHTVEKRGERKKLNHQAWLVEASYVLTGDPNSYEGVAVKESFDLAKRTFGALELSVRYQELRLDDETFPTYANPALSARRARSFGAILFWHWSRNLAWLVDFDQTHFAGGAPDGGDRPTENALFTRAQLVF